MGKEIFLMFFSYKSLLKYVLGEHRRYDLLFFFLFIGQVSILPSIPSGFHSPNAEGWLGFGISSVFSLFFYLGFYFNFYRGRDFHFIREVVVFSVVARLHSFFFTGGMALAQIGIWSFLGIKKIPNTSLVYYLLYYALFALIMVLFKKRCIRMKTSE